MSLRCKSFFGVGDSKKCFVQKVALITGGSQHQTCTPSPGALVVRFITSDESALGMVASREAMRAFLSCLRPALRPPTATESHHSALKLNLNGAFAKPGQQRRSLAS